MINSKRIIDAIDQEIELGFTYMKIKKDKKEPTLNIQALNRLRKFVCSEEEYEKLAYRNVIERKNYKAGDENY